MENQDNIVIVDITDHRLEISKKIERETARNYKAKLMEGASAEGDDINFAPGQFDIAVQYLVARQVSKVVKTAAGEPGEAITVDSEWYDRLDNVDYEKISKAVLKIKTEHDEKIKKL